MPDETLLPRYYLECNNSQHNKFYDIYVEMQGSTYVVKARYGRRYTSGRVIRKGSSSMLHGATAQAQRLRNEKLAKGYKVAELPGSVKKMTKKKVKTKPKQPTKKSVSLERFSHILD